MREKDNSENESERVKGRGKRLPYSNRKATRRLRTLSLGCPSLNLYDVRKLLRPDISFANVSRTRLLRWLPECLLLYVN